MWKSFWKKPRRFIGILGSSFLDPSCQLPRNPPASVHETPPFPLTFWISRLPQRWVIEDQGVRHICGCLGWISSENKNCVDNTRVSNQGQGKKHVFFFGDDGETDMDSQNWDEFSRKIWSKSYFYQGLKHRKFTRWSAGSSASQPRQVCVWWGSR